MSNLPNFPTIRPSLLLDFANSGGVDPRITFTRASTATYYDAQGVLRTAASGVPRIDHDPVTGECSGLLIEEARTNLLIWSEDFSNAYWAKGNATVMANVAIAPSGALTADKLVEDTNSTTHRIAQPTNVISGTTYTYSVFIKAGERTNAAIMFGTDSGAFPDTGARFDLITGSATTLAGSPNATVKNMGNGWYRCSVTATALATASSITRIFIFNGAVQGYTGDGTSGVFIWGAQFEQGAFPTSYIPTTTAAATRAADAASMTGTNFSEWYRADEGTFVAMVSRASTGRSFTVSDGTANENMRVNLSASSPLRPDWQVIDAGTTQVATSSTPNVPLDSNFTFAAAYKKDDFAISVNGTEAVTDTGGTLPLVDRMHLGAPESGVATGGANFRRIAFFPKRLANAELQAISS